MSLNRHKKSKHVFQAQGYYRYFQKPRTNFLLTPGSGQQPKIAVRPLSPSSQISEFVVDERIIRMGLRGIKSGVKKTVPKFVPVLGWVLTGKDIYDIITD